MSPVTDVPSASEYESAQAARLCPQSQRTKTMKKILRTRFFYQTKGRRERKFKDENLRLVIAEFEPGDSKIEPSP
jgi:hypothetical protein